MKIYLVNCIDKTNNTEVVGSFFNKINAQNYVKKIVIDNLNYEAYEALYLLKCYELEVTEINIELHIRSFMSYNVEEVNVMDELEPMTDDGHVAMSQEELEQAEIEELDYWLDRQGDM